MDNLFFEITALLGLATILAILFRFAKQPPILAYILTGIILGPLHLVEAESQEVIHSLAEIGITLLLFMVGLELKIGEFRYVGKVALITGIGQIVITTVLGFLVSILLGFSPLASIYIAFAITFSSTIIIIKLLSDKKELATLHGKIAVGILLVQDLVAILMLVMLNGLSQGATGDVPVVGILITLVKALVLFITVIIASNYIFPPLVKFIAKSQETLFIFAISWAFGVATFAASDMLGLSLEVGGFVAGMALANTVESYQIITKIRPLRDFFIILFFINLGIGLDLSNFAGILPMALLLSGFIIIGNPLIMMGIMRQLGYRRKTSFYTGISLAQISEFSLILIFLARQLGHVDDQVVSLITTVGIITFITSSYSIINSQKLFKIMKPYLGIFERRRNKVSDKLEQEIFKNHVVIIGGNRIGTNIIEKVRTSDQQIVVVDYDPMLAEEFGNDPNLHFIPGDISDPEVQEESNIFHAEVVVSTIPIIEDNVILISKLKNQNKKVKFIAAVHRDVYAEVLYQAGADHVIYPYAFVGNSIGNIIRHKGYERLDKFEVEVG